MSGTPGKADPESSFRIKERRGINNKSKIPLSQACLRKLTVSFIFTSGSNLINIVLFGS
jgi:hypothetical protein